VFVKNIMVFSKGVWLSRQARRLDADHLHAHWGSTSSTMALVAGEISGIPWSFTAHRWDIPENNLLETKTAKACFVRTISVRGARVLSAQLGAPAPNLHVLHMGIEIPEAIEPPRRHGDGRRLNVVVMADFVEVKGHRDLLEALKLLKDRGPLIRVDLAGDGPLRIEIERQIREAGLSKSVALLGTLPHARLLHDLRTHRWDAAVLSSVATEEFEEGIPVSLMEAMAAGVPVLSTRTGAIPELLGEGAGLLVEGGDPVALADALEELARNPALLELLAEKGRRRVSTDFNVLGIARVLSQYFARCATTHGLARGIEG
jgi:glycosyltransferase involved in cell wall biosynthesis